MQDRASAGSAADNLPAAFFEARTVHVCEGLGIPKREAGWGPRVQPEGRKGVAASNICEDRFIDSHVPRAGRGRGEEESPWIHGNIVLNCTQIPEFFLSGMKEQGKNISFVVQLNE